MAERAIKRPLLESKTTRAVAGGTVAGGGGVVAIIAALRAMGVLPWPVEADAALVTVAGVIVIPLASRLWAHLRKSKAGAVWLPYVLALAGASLLLGGCAATTRTLPDGTVEVLRTVDPEQADMWFRIADQAIARIQDLDKPSAEEQARQAEWETFRAALVRYVLDRALGEPAVPPDPPQPLALQVLDGAKL